MKNLVLILILIVVSSCESNQNNRKLKSIEIKDNLVYFKDYNTNLCFCSVGSVSYGINKVVTSITNVPCDSLVLNQIK